MKKACMKGLSYIISFIWHWKGRNIKIENSGCQGFEEDWISEVKEILFEEYETIQCDTVMVDIWYHGFVKSVELYSQRERVNVYKFNLGNMGIPRNTQIVKK